MSATTRRPTVASSGGDPLAEAVELTRRLKLPHLAGSRLHLELGAIVMELAEYT